MMEADKERELIKKTARELKNLGLFDDDELSIKVCADLISEEHFQIFIKKLIAAPSYDRMQYLIMHLKSNVLITKQMYKYIESQFHWSKHQELKIFFEGRIIDLEKDNKFLKIAAIIGIGLCVFTLGMCFGMLF